MSYDADDDEIREFVEDNLVQFEAMGWTFDDAVEALRRTRNAYADLDDVLGLEIAEVSYE